MKRVVFILILLMSLFSAPVAIFAETAAYIPNNGDGRVSRIITADETTTPVDFGDDPYGAAVSPQGDYLVVTRPSADSVTIVATREFTDPNAQFKCQVGDEPRGVAIDATATYAYSANFSGNTVSEIAITSASLTDTYEVGHGPWGVTVFYDADKKHRIVYVANHLDDSISIIKDGEVTTINNVGDGPVGVALSPDGAYLYVALTNANAVAIIKTSDNTVVKRINTGNAPWAVAVGSNGAYLYVTNSGSESVTIIDTNKQVVYDTLSVMGQEPRGVACPKNGNIAYVVNHGDHSINRINIDNKSIEIISPDQINESYALGNFIGGPPPNEPSSLRIEAISFEGIDLSWADNATDELGFKIERRIDSEDNFTQVATVAANVTTYSDNGLHGDAKYHYRIRAYNETADSDYSDAVEATTEHKRFTWCFLGTISED